jgi:NADH:ubiquinone oxidoreductase subunit 4 (subunit M)
MLLKGHTGIFPVFLIFWILFLAANLGAPPIINFMGEVILIVSGLKWRLLGFPLLMIIIILSAGYSLFLYSIIYIGKAWFLYGLDIIRIREYTLVIFHLVPLFLFILRAVLFFSWV